MTSNIERTAKQINLGGIIAIIRGDYPLDKLIEIGDALLAAPVLAMEIILNSSNALEAITKLHERAGENMLIGAGTVRTVEQTRAALEAGAQFTVSPGFNPMAQYVQAGAVAVGIGGSLISGSEASMAEIIATARALMTKIQAKN